MPSHTTGQELLDAARGRVREISANDALALDRADASIVFLDVRDQHEVNLGRIPDALHVSRGNLETKIEALLPREKRVVVYCANGNRSLFAADTLQTMGYRDVVSLRGGFRDWAGSGGDVEA